MWEEHKHCAKSPQTSKWEKNWRFVRESLMLEKRVSRNMVSIVNSFCSLKEFCLLLTVFLDEQYHICAEPHHSSELEKHCSYCKRRINFTIKRVLHLVKHGELCLFLKGTLPVSVFMGEDQQLWTKTSAYNKWEKNGRFIRESLMLETRGSSEIFIIVNSVFSLKEYCLPLSVFWDEQHHFCAESPNSRELEKHCSSCQRRINFTSKRVLHLVTHGELC
jgi:hypothetical protein